MENLALEPKILFSDYFNISKEAMDEYGAFDVSLILDLPLFIDPFLLFESDKPQYQQLHQEIIKYLTFLRDKSISGKLNDGLLKEWYFFKEVEQNWFGFSTNKNRGNGLGEEFANALNANFYRLFPNYGEENITSGTHLEKLCLFKDRVGKDNISDFTTNLIKHFLLDYTQIFSKKYIDPKYCDIFRVKRAKFNYETESWQEKTYYLPRIEGGSDGYVILTPKDLLTRDNTWINRQDLIDDFKNIPPSIPNIQLRAKINNYFITALPKQIQKTSKKERDDAARETIIQFPEIIDYYIKYKEDTGDGAKSISRDKVAFSEDLYISKFKKLSYLLSQLTPFYKNRGDTYEESMQRVMYLKQVIENNDGYRYFYDKSENPIRTELEFGVRPLIV